MNASNIDYIMNIFKTLTGELPEQMLYREDGDSFELKAADSTSGLSLDLQNSGWSLIDNRLAGAA